MLGIFSRSWVEPVPRVFLEEPHRGVEGRAAPHLDREDFRAEPAVGVGHAEHVAGPDPGRQQRLVGIAERRVGQQERVLLADPVREALGPQFLEDLPRALGRRRWSCRSSAGPARSVRAPSGVLSHAGETVDDDLGHEGQQLRRPVLRDRELEELGRLVEEPGGGPAFEKIGVVDDVEQERDVRLDPSDAKLAQGPLHPPSGVDEPSTAGADLDQQRVVKRRDDRPGGRQAAVEPEAEAAGRSIVGDLAVVGRELVLGVLGRDPALEGEPLRVDRVLARAG